MHCVQLFALHYVRWCSRLFGSCGEWLPLTEINWYKNNHCTLLGFPFIWLGNLKLIEPITPKIYFFKYSFCCPFCGLLNSAAWDSAPDYVLHSCCLYVTLLHCSMYKCETVACNRTSTEKRWRSQVRKKREEEDRKELLCNRNICLFRGSSDYVLGEVNWQSVTRHWEQKNCVSKEKVLESSISYVLRIYWDLRHLKLQI